MTPEDQESKAGPDAIGQEPEAAAPSLPPEEETAPAIPSPVPWEDPGVSRVAGLFRTLRQVLFSPGDFFRNMPREGWAEALGFGLIVGTAGILASLYWHLLFYVGLSRSLGQTSLSACLFGRVEWALIPMMVLTPAMILANLLYSSLGLWTAVGLTGGPWVWTPVWRIACYAQGSMAVGVIPFLGGPVAGLWNLVLYYKGLRGCLDLSAWRALGVLCLSLALQVLLVILLFGSLWGLRLLAT